MTMKKRWIKTSIAILLSVFQYSCGTPQASVINDLETLVNDVEENHAEYTVEDWERVTVSYSEIEEELLQYEYTDEELKEIGRLKGRYIGYLTKYTVEELKQGVHDIMKELEGGIEGFMEVLETDNNP